MTGWTRAALLQDLSPILALERSTPELPHWTDAEYGRYLDPAAEDRLLCVAGEAGGGSIAGFAAARLTPASTDLPKVGRIAELESLAVLPAARRSGLGSLLCSSILDWARARNAEALELEVRSKSTGAIALYESLGLNIVGRRSQYYAKPNDDALLMTLALPRAEPIYNCGNHGS
jgi:ribosomal-protein-alanine N-acetyltransferase